jgi:hypothetical protein
VGIERLRPNLVLAGVEAHDEDRLAELRIATADGGGAQARQALRALPHPQHRPADGREQPRGAGHVEPVPRRCRAWTNG